MTIVPPQRSDAVMLSNDTRFFVNGEELRDVTRCVVEYQTDRFVTATVDIGIVPTTDIEAHPLLSLKCLHHAAAMQGYELVRYSSRAREAKAEAERAVGRARRLAMMEMALANG